jgi:hypothetical protein
MSPTSTDKANRTGQVVDLGDWRQRRAWDAALDHLDRLGLCACWVTGRKHRGAS